MQPGLTVFDVMWRLPVCTAGYLLVQAGRKNGVKGIGRPVRDELLWRRWQELHGTDSPGK